MKPKFCEKCGQKLSEENIFCEHCGWRVTDFGEAIGHAEAIGHDEVIDHAGTIDHNKIISHNRPASHIPGESPAGKPASITQESASAIDPPKTEKKNLSWPRLIGILLLFVGVLVLWRTVFKSTKLMKAPLVSDKGVFFADFNRDSCLYRVDLEGKTKKKLSKKYIKVMDMEDDWIYYSSIFGIYKIRDDGTDETQILDQTAEFISVSDGWVYFTEKQDYHICRIKTDGTEFEQLGDDFACDLRHEAGWLYYRNADAGHCIFRIRTDGSERQQVTADKISFCNYDVSDGVVYYSNDDELGHLYSINGDGTERQKLNEYSTYSITVKDGWIYHGQGWEGHPTKIRIDGSEETTISDDYAECLVVFDDWIYYTDSRKGEGLYKIKVDGSERKKLLR